MKSCQEIFGNIHFLLKFIAWIILIIGSIIMALGDIMYYDRFTMQTTAVAVAGYTLILTGMIIVYICDEPHRLLEILLLITGAALNIVAGILNLVEYCRVNENVRTINSLIILILCLAAGAVMIVDVVLTFLK